MNQTFSEQAVVLAPRGRDAIVAVAMLQEAGIAAGAAGSLPAFVAIVRSGAGFGIVTEEALREADLRPLVDFLAAQDEWSDFPFIILTERGGGIERNPAAVRLLEALGNVTFLERPFHPTTLLSLARAALRARRRQYEARARLETIRAAEEQLRLALAAGGLGAWRLDIRDENILVLDCSADCKSHYGRGPDEPFGYEELLACVHPDDQAHRARTIDAALAEGRDYDVEYRCIWPDGSIHWVQVRGQPERGTDGRVVRMTGVSHDITQRKTAEDTLKNFALELERRVEERTHEREVAVAQLHEAQKLETLGQLTGGVAHDFNNLLTPVMGGLDLLRRMHKDDRSQRIIDGALQASERARTLVARLLAFARRQNLEARAVDMGGLVNGMIDLIQRSIGPRIAIELAIDQDLPAAFVDPNQLELALLNLAVNARDAMPEGGRLAISVLQQQVGAGHAQLDPGTYLRLRVADSGTGMDEVTLKRAVEPFYSTKGVGKGTGLGLSMVHGLAAQSGGTLELSSVLGGGTRCDLWLPAAPTAAPGKVESIEDEPVTGERLSVLVIDDEELVRNGTAEMLGGMGHDVVQAPSATVGLAMLHTHDFDLVVTDYLMPGMSGLDFAREARRSFPGLPVLLATGFSDLADSASADVVRLAKPFRQQELERALTRLFA